MVRRICKTAQATNINGQIEHLQMKYVGTGHADIQKQCVRVEDLGDRFFSLPAPVNGLWFLWLGVHLAFRVCRRRARDVACACFWLLFFQ